MRKAYMIAIVPGVLVVIALVLVLALFLVKLVWAWTIPDIFPGAVKQGLVARDISWYTAFKLAVTIAVLFGTARGSAHRAAVHEKAP